MLGGPIVPRVTQFFNMKKIRINELARDLEVKPHMILDLLPDLGVAEKKTHSSSIDEDVALVIRRRLLGEESATSNGPAVAEAPARAAEVQPRLPQAQAAIAPPTRPTLPTPH